MHIDGVAVRFCARHVFAGDIAASASAVLHDHGAVDDGAQLFGEMPHQHIGAAACGKCADEMDISIRVVMGKRLGKRGLGCEPE